MQRDPARSLSSTDRAEIERIAATLSPLYTEALNSTHPFVAKMQPVNPIALVEHILDEVEKGKRL